MPGWFALADGSNRKKVEKQSISLPLIGAGCPFTQ
jgi:hypothetical protein